MIKEIAFSVYAVTDMKKARAFYEGILGLKVGAEFDGSKNPNWVEYNIGKSALAIGSSPDWKPSEHGASVALETDKFDEMIKKLKKHKVVFQVEPQDYPTCSMAVVNDPDKNKIIIHKKKSK